MDRILHTRVLVVDDDEDNADLIAELLRDRGNDVRVARDGRTALEMNREFLAEVALIDLGLPGMDGYEVALHLRASRPSIRLIALTGHAHADVATRVRASGFDEHLIKPARVEQIESAIERRLVTSPP